MPQSQQRWIVPRQQVIPTPPTSVRLLLDPKQFPTRCSVVPPSFSRLSPSQFPAAAFLHQRTATTPNVWFRLISHFFLHNYLIFFLSLWREPNFWQLNPELAQEIMQRIDWLTRMWWSWMQFWQRSYFDATAWYWEADIELSAQKLFWSVSQKLLAFDFHPTASTAVRSLHCQWFHKTCPHCPNSDITGTYYFASGARN